MNETRETELRWILKEYYKEKGKVGLYNLLDNIINESDMEFWNLKTTRLELGCPAIMELTNRDNLNHKERMALLLVYKKLGNEGKERLMTILKQQKNYDENKTKKIIEGFLKKDNGLVVSCAKLQEWNICDDKCSDCHKYKKKENKNAESIG